MANLVIASNSKAMSKLDGSIKKKVFDFFEKLSEDDTLLSLHIEPLHVSSDPRVRTGRVDLHYRAVLFKVEDKSNIPTYIYMGTWNHDDAIKLAEKATLRSTPSTARWEGLSATPNRWTNHQRRRSPWRPPRRPLCTPTSPGSGTRSRTSPSGSASRRPLRRKPWPPRTKQS